MKTGKSWWMIEKASRGTTALELEGRPSRLLLESEVIMNMRAKFVFSIGLLGLLCLVVPGSLRADTIYTYTGNPYTFCYGTYCPGPNALSITIDVKAGTPLDNLTYTDITADVLSYSFTDGSGRQMTQFNSSHFGFIISTGPTGEITGDWTAVACSPECTVGPLFTMYTNYFVQYGSGEDVSDVYSATSNIGYASNINSPGVWTGGATTPEPSTYLLLGTGLLGLLALAARSKRHAPPISC